MAGTWFLRSHVHLAFVTKYRREVLDGAMLTCCEEAMGKVCADFRAELAAGPVRASTDSGSSPERRHLPADASLAQAGDA